MNTSAPSDSELHAYVDGLLPAARAAEIAAWLRGRPQVQAQVAGWKRDAEALRAAWAGDDTQAPNPLLDPAQLRVRVRRRRRGQLGIVASCVLALGLGGVGGWHLRESRLVVERPPMADAVAAYRLFVDGHAPMEFDAGGRRALAQWLQAHFGRSGDIPDLRAQGYRLHGGRLLSTPEGAAAMLVYEDHDGARIGLYLRPRVERFRDGERRDGRLLAQYWIEGDTALALVGPATLTAMRQISPLLRGDG